MSGGSNSLKPGQPRGTNINTVQTLLKAKLGSTKEKAPKKGRTHSQLSNDSNNSIEFDLSGLDHIQKDLEEIKSSLQGVTKITDLNEATKDLVKSTELETLVTVIVNKLLNNFESKLETKFETKLTQVTNNMQEKIDALSMENENLKGQLDATKNVLGNVKTTLNRNVILTKTTFTVLGINFDVDISKITKINYEKYFKKMKGLFKQWNKRKLTPIGKITVVKSLILPVLNHLFVALPNPSIEIIKDIEAMLYTFIWKSSVNRVKKDIMQKKYQEGGGGGGGGGGGT